MKHQTSPGFWCEKYGYLLIVSVITFLSPDFLCATLPQLTQEPLTHFFTLPDYDLPLMPVSNCTSQDRNMTSVGLWHFCFHGPLLLVKQSKTLKLCFTSALL